MPTFKSIFPLARRFIPTAARLPLSAFPRSTAYKSFSTKPDTFKKSWDADALYDHWQLRSNPVKERQFSEIDWPGTIVGKVENLIRISRILPGTGQRDLLDILGPDVFSMLYMDPKFSNLQRLLKVLTPKSQAHLIHMIFVNNKERCQGYYRNLLITERVDLVIVLNSVPAAARITLLKMLGDNFYDQLQRQKFFHDVAFKERVLALLDPDGQKLFREKFLYPDGFIHALKELPQQSPTAVCEFLKKFSAEDVRTMIPSIERFSEALKNLRSQDKRQLLEKLGAAGIYDILTGLDNNNPFKDGTLKYILWHRLSKEDQHFFIELFFKDERSAKFCRRFVFDHAFNAPIQQLLDLLEILPEKSRPFVLNKFSKQQLRDIMRYDINSLPIQRNVEKILMTLLPEDRGHYEEFFKPVKVSSLLRSFGNFSIPEKPPAFVESSDTLTVALTAKSS